MKFPKINFRDSHQIHIVDIAFDYLPSYVTEMFKYKMNDMVDNTLELKLTELSYSGIPCIWEEGGRINDNLGYSVIVCNKFGLPITPTFIKYQHREDLKLENNYQIALFPIKKGYYVGFGLYLNGNIHIRICKIKIPRNRLEFTKLKIIYSCMNNTMINDYPVRFQLFINAIVSKCMIHYNHKTFYYNSRLLKSIESKGIKHKIIKTKKRGR